MPSSRNCTVSSGPSATNRYLSVAVACFPLLLCLLLLKPLALVPWWLLAQAVVISLCLLIFLLRRNAAQQLRLTLFDNGELLLKQATDQQEQRHQLCYVWISSLGVLLAMQPAKGKSLRWLWLAHDAMPQAQFRPLCRLLNSLLPQIKRQ